MINDLHANQITVKTFDLGPQPVINRQGGSMMVSKNTTQKSGGGIGSGIGSGIGGGLKKPTNVKTNLAGSS